MLTVGSDAVYQESLNALVAYRQRVGNSHKGRFVQLYLGLKCYSEQIPSMWSGRYIGTDVLQTLLDDL